MGKFYGLIGYASQVETSPGVFTEQITEKNHYGDVIRSSRKTQSGEGLNDNLTLENRVSIVADPFASTNFPSMRYVKWMGALWKITAVEDQRPRLILTIGGVYNGRTT